MSISNLRLRLAVLPIAFLCLADMATAQNVPQGGIQITTTYPRNCVEVTTSTRDLSDTWKVDPLVTPTYSEVHDQTAMLPSPANPIANINIASISDRRDIYNWPTPLDFPPDDTCRTVLYEFSIGNTSPPVVDNPSDLWDEFSSSTGVHNDVFALQAIKEENSDPVLTEPKLMGKDYTLPGTVIEGLMFMDYAQYPVYFTIDASSIPDMQAAYPVTTLDGYQPGIVHSGANIYVVDRDDNGFFVAIHKTYTNLGLLSGDVISALAMYPAFGVMPPIGLPPTPAEVGILFALEPGSPSLATTLSAGSGNVFAVKPETGLLGPGDPAWIYFGPSDLYISENTTISSLRISDPARFNYGTGDFPLPWSLVVDRKSNPNVWEHCAPNFMVEIDDDVSIPVDSFRIQQKIPHPQPGTNPNPLWNFTIFVQAGRPVNTDHHTLVFPDGIASMAMLPNFATNYFMPANGPATVLITNDPMIGALANVTVSNVTLPWTSPEVSADVINLLGGMLTFQTFMWTSDYNGGFDWGTSNPISVTTHY